MFGKNRHLNNVLICLTLITNITYKDAQSPDRGKVPY